MALTELKQVFPNLSRLLQMQYQCVQDLVLRKQSTYTTYLGNPSRGNQVVYCHKHLFLSKNHFFFVKYELRDFIPVLSTLSRSF